MNLFYGTGTTPHGRVFIAWSDKGLIALRMMAKSTESALASEMRERFPNAEWSKNKKQAAEWIEQINAALRGNKPAHKMKIDWQGTPFQNRVWQALLRVPFGKTCTYSDLAKKIGKPKAVRAVANACAKNQIGLLVPCHRVIRRDGSLGGYYWGVERKRKMLDFEGTGS